MQEGRAATPGADDDQRALSRCVAVRHRAKLTGVAARDPGAAAGSLRPVCRLGRTSGFRLRASGRHRGVDSEWDRGDEAAGDGKGSDISTLTKTACDRARRLAATIAIASGSEAASAASGC